MKRRPTFRNMVWVRLIKKKNENWILNDILNLKLDDENKYISIGNEKINKNLFRRDTNSKIEGNDLVKNKINVKVILIL